MKIAPTAAHAVDNAIAAYANTLGSMREPEKNNAQRQKQSWSGDDEVKVLEGRNQHQADGRHECGSTCRALMQNIILTRLTLSDAGSEKSHPARPTLCRTASVNKAEGEKDNQNGANCLQLGSPQDPAIAVGTEIEQIGSRASWRRPWINGNEIAIKTTPMVPVTPANAHNVVAEQALGPQSASYR